MFRWIPPLIFFSVFFLIYGGVHFYLYKRIRGYTKFPQLVYKGLKILFPLLIVSPVISRMFAWDRFFWLGYWYVLISSLWMGYVFYFFLSNLTVDLGNGLYRCIKRFTCWRRPFLLPRNYKTFVAMLLIPLAVCTYAWFEALNIGVTNIAFKTAKLYPGTQRIVIAQISDVHLGILIREERLSGILTLLQKIQPDILISSGDFLDQEVDNVNYLAPMFNSFTPPLGKYAVLGNHEFYAGVRQSTTFIERAGFRLLRNDCIQLPGLLNLIGIDDPAGKRFDSSSKLDVNALFSKRNPDLYTVFLFHRPPNSEDYFGRLPIDLQLSGHTHDGQLFPFRLLTGIFFPLKGGLYSENGRHLYVSRGTGTWGPPLRFLTPPEITVITITPAQPAPGKAP